MFCLNDNMRYFLCGGYTDMRKRIFSLSGLVHDKMGGDVRSFSIRLHTEMIPTQNPIP